MVSETGTYTLHDDPPAITCHRCGVISHHPMDIQHRYCGHCHHFHADGPQTTLAHWRFALGQKVRWAGDHQVWTIVQRRWLERQHCAPYAAYYVERGRDWGWCIEAHLEAATEPPDAAGEGQG